MRPDLAIIAICLLGFYLLRRFDRPWEEDDNDLSPRVPSSSSDARDELIADLLEGVE